MTLREEVEADLDQRSKEFLRDHPVLFGIIYHVCNTVVAPRFWFQIAVLKFRVWLLKREARAAIAKGRLNEIPEIITRLRAL